MKATESLSLPAIEFSEWYPWLERNKIPGCNFPGIYIIARFLDDLPEGNADPLDYNVIDIGETRKSLKTRWDDFHDAAFGKGKRKHSAGRHYREKRYPLAIEALYVAAMPSPPRRWSGILSADNKEIAQIATNHSRESVSINNIEKFKKHLDTLSAPAKLKGTLNGVWIKFVERRLLLDYVLKWGKLPEHNLV